MHIISVEMKDCAYSPDTGRIHATLLMNADAQRLSLRAAAKYQKGMRRREVAKVLLEDALRQLGRMPEFRNRTDRITIAKEAIPSTAGMPAAA